MSQNKRRKMDFDAACSSASVNNQEISTSMLDDSGELHIAQQTARANYMAGSRSTNENEEKAIFKANVSDFREAVKWSGFVDRSLLIKELLSDDTIVIVLAPEHFGKSMNVDMVKCFLEIEGDRDVTKAPQDLKELEKFENFKAFHKYEIKQPCKILAEAKLVKEHFGRHPVVHITFKDVEVSSIQAVENSMRELVHRAYCAHSYLISDSSRDEGDNKYCRIWCDPKKYIDHDAVSGLEVLIKDLHAYHKRKVYLLVDDFDAPAVKALLAGKSGDEVKKINNKVTHLLGAVVKGQIADQHLLGSLITGVSYLGSLEFSGSMNNVTAYKWLLGDEGRFAPYYGLSHDDLTTLLEHVFPNQEQERVTIQGEVEGLYNGYSFQGEPVYCLWSVLHYIRDRSRLDALKITNTSYWGGSSIITKMGSLLTNRVIMAEIMNIIGGNGYVTFSPCRKVDVEVLANFMNESEYCSSGDIFFSFFLDQGYLTHVLDHQRKNVGSRYMDMTIPNAEVLVAFQEMFKNFSLAICGLSDSEMEKCAKVFKDLPIDRDDETFKKKLRDFYNHLEVLLQNFNRQEAVKERSLQAVLYTIMLKAGFKECCMKKYVTKDSKFSKIDLWLFNDNFAAIFTVKNFKHKKSAQKALEEIRSGNKTKKVPYVKILDQYSSIKNYLLIGISMNGKGKPYMCCLVNSLDDKDCIFFPEDD